MGALKDAYFLISLGSLYFLRNCSTSRKLSNIYLHKIEFFVVFSYHPLNVHGIYSDFLLSSLILVICVFNIFLTLSRRLLILLIFSKIQIFGFINFVCFSIFDFIAFCSFFNTSFSLLWV